MLRNKPFLFALRPWILFDADDTGNSTQTNDDKNADGGGKQAGLSQEQVNQIVADRVKRAEEAAAKKLLESFGVKDADEARALIEAKKKADDLAKTELEKLAENAKKLEEKAAKLEAENTAKVAQMEKRLQDSEIKMQALRPVVDKEGKVIRPAFLPDATEEVLLLVNREKISEKDGVYAGIDEALKDLAKAKPHLLAAAEKVQPKGTPRPGERLPKSDEKEDRSPLLTSL